MFEEGSDPNEVLERIVALESASRARLKASRAQLAVHSQVGEKLFEELARRSLSFETKGHLDSVGIDFRVLEDLHRKRAHYNQLSGYWSRLGVENPPESRIEAESVRVGGLWLDIETRLEGEVESALSERAQQREAARPAVEHLHSQEPPLTRMPMSETRRYAGADLQQVGLTGTLPHRMWIAEPATDVEWARLPYLNHNRVGTTWFPGNPGLNFDQACAGVRDLVVEQMSLAVPRLLQLTWIDPATRGGSAGALLELLEIDKDLMDTQVWSEADQIDRALRRISDHISYIEQRCLKDRFEDLDAYNAGGEPC